MENNEDLINYSVEDLMGGDFSGKSIVEIQEKIRNNENFRKVILYLGISFFNHHNSAITVKQLNDTIIKKTYDYTAKLMDYLVIQKFLLKSKKERINYYLLNREEDNISLFKEFVGLAKQIQFGGKNGSK